MSTSGYAVVTTLMQPKIVPAVLAAIFQWILFYDFNEVVDCGLLIPAKVGRGRSQGVEGRAGAFSQSCVPLCALVRMRAYDQRSACERTHLLVDQPRQLAPIEFVDCGCAGPDLLAPARSLRGTGCRWLYSRMSQRKAPCRCSVRLCSTCGCQSHVPLTTQLRY